MKYLNDEESYVLEDGTKLSPNVGILGITPRDGELYEGYDSTITGNKRYGYLELTYQQRHEIAELMAKHWLEWAERSQDIKD